MSKNPFVVLLAEDSEHDIVAIKRAWKKNHITNPLHVVRDGEECLDYIYRRGSYAEAGAAPRPGILLLDIKMPKMDGLAVLDHIRNDKAISSLPVIMLTTSKAEQDRLVSYEKGATAYITKPVGFEALSRAIVTINLFWQLVELPEI